MNIKQYNESLQKGKSISESLLKGKTVDCDKELLNRFNDEDRIKKIEESSNRHIAQRDAQRLIQAIEGKIIKKKYNKIIIGCISSITAIVVIIIFIQIVHKESKIISEANTCEYLSPTLVLGNGTSKSISDSISLIEDINTLQNTNCTTTVDSIHYNNYTIIVPPKFTRKITLIDSSIITINAGSTVKYSDANIRYIELDGEAYFQIKKDSNTPFIIKTNIGAVKVYGTTFNINSYSLEQEETITLVEGLLGYTDALGKEQLILPKQQLSCNYSSKSATINDIDPNLYLGWIKNKFIFDQTPLTKVISEIERWYGIQIKHKSNLNDIEITLVLNRSTNLDTTLKFISNIINRQIIVTDYNTYEII